MDARVWLRSHPAEDVTYHWLLPAAWEKLPEERDGLGKVFRHRAELRGHKGRTF